MNSNVPKKIYLADTTFPDYIDFDGSPINTKRIDEYDIEYTRTDAFIEKAAKWLEENINEYTDGEGIEFTADMTYNIDILFQEKLINEFKKAMKL